VRQKTTQLTVPKNITNVGARCCAVRHQRPHFSSSAATEHVAARIRAVTRARFATIMVKTPEGAARITTAATTDSVSLGSLEARCIRSSLVTLLPKCCMLEVSIPAKSM